MRWQAEKQERLTKLKEESLRVANASAYNGTVDTETRRSLSVFLQAQPFDRLRCAWPSAAQAVQHSALQRSAVLPCLVPRGRALPATHRPFCSQTRSASRLC